MIDEVRSDLHGWKWETTTFISGIIISLIYFFIAHIHTSQMYIAALFL